MPASIMENKQAIIYWCKACQACDVDIYRFHKFEGFYTITICVTCGNAAYWGFK